MTIKDTPFDCSLGKYCSLDSDYNFIGKKALLTQSKRGPFRDIYKVYFEAPPNLDSFDVSCYAGDKKIGKLTSLIFSPKFNKYLGFMITKKENINNDKEFFVKIRTAMYKASIENF